MTLAHPPRDRPGGAELQQPLVRTAEGVDQVLVQCGQKFQGGVGAAGEEGFARLALQLEDDPVVGHRTRGGARLAADEADLAEDAAGGELGKELLAAAHTHGHVNVAADDDEAAAARPTFADHHSSPRQVPASHEAQQPSKLAFAEISKERKVPQRIRLDRRPRLRGHPLQRHG